MEQILTAGQRSGVVEALASKSQAHRQLICAALSDNPSVIICDGMSKDILATIDCLNALGAMIRWEADEILVAPILRCETTATCHLFCGESGSTLRFLLPVVGALGKNAIFHMEGRLPERPLGPFAKELKSHGMQIVQEDTLLHVSGQLSAGTFTLPGNISSQYISGLLMALPLLDEDSAIHITGKIESQNYILMTEDAVRFSGVVFEGTVSEAGDKQAPSFNFAETDDYPTAISAIPETADRMVLQYHIPGAQTYRFPIHAETERDWSNATFFLCMGALSAKGVTVAGLSLDSSQGDKAVLDVLANFGAEVLVSKDVSNRVPGKTEITVRKKPLHGCVIDASKIPDMVPAISVVAAVAQGETQITHAERLRIKESDRLQTVCRMLTALGADVKETEDGLVICGKETLAGGVVDAANDHRIAMAAAVAACAATAPVTVQDAGCVSKSYPGFWEDLNTLEISRPVS